jgi:hypothetical protein
MSPRVISVISVLVSAGIISLGLANSLLSRLVISLPCKLLGASQTGASLVQSERNQSILS